ncbi:MAG TPA: LPS assembly protein LptD [Arenimonas sp.]|nr:LPS assembly protein LptD [Arenimonas sp.]
MRDSKISIALILLFTAGQSNAQSTEITWEVCENPDALPLFRPLSSNPSPNPELLPSFINADVFNIHKLDESVFEGNVEMERGEEWLNTEKLIYNHQSGKYKTDGMVKFQNSTLRMTAESAQGNAKTETIELSDLEYQFHDNNANGSAEKVAVQGRDSVLTQANFSTCPANNKHWQFVADEISINDAEKKGVAKNAVLKIGGVPIFWLPYIKFPTDSARSSGFLSPTIGQDEVNGIDIALPYYLNIAPNFDATLIPRYLSNRGFFIGTEFRYLFDKNYGEISATYLRDDEIRDIERYLLSSKHFSAISSNWHFSSDLNYASDVNYFTDFGSSLAKASTALLESEIGLFGRGKYWNVELSTSSWQIVNPTQTPESEPYFRIPRLALNGSKPIVPWFEVGLNAEAVIFRHELLEDGNRLDITPYIKFPITGSFWYATPSLSWRQTEYWLNNLDETTNSHLSRGLSIFSVDAGANFERSVDFAGQSFIQTLEPRIFYLYVPYRNQDDFPVFDTEALTFMWSSLFRENRYGGADRQADANQITAAITSRFLNEKTGKELMNFSLGRINFINASRVYLPAEVPQPSGGSDWVAEVNFRLSEQWQIGLTQQWSPSTKYNQLTSIQGFWSMPNGLQFNANYRYLSENTEQIDLAFVLPINKSWRAMGRWDYSLLDNQNLETMLGFEWRSCCLAFRVFGRKFIRSFTSQDNLGIYLELELNGIGQIGSKPELFRDNGILPY